MTLRRSIGFFILFSSLKAAGATSLGGVETPYSPVLLKRSLMNNATDVYREKSPQDATGLSFTCFATASDDYYVGAGQYQTIAAPIDVVAKILKDFDRYTDWADGLVASKTEKLDGDRYLVITEQEIPIPLVSNIHTQLLYEVKEGKDSTTFRYQLKKSDSLTAYDGLIVLQPGPNQTTQFAEYDILNADWGVAKAMGVQKIWTDSLKAMYQGDLAVKMQAENPKMPVKEVLKTSIKKADERDFKPCFEKRTKLDF